MFKKLSYLLLMLIVGVTSTWADNMTTMVGQVGLTDNSGGFYAYASKPVQLNAGTSYVYTFVNYNKGSEGTYQWETWAVKGWYYGTTNEFFVRADADENANGLSAVGYTIACDKKWTSVSTDAKTWLQQYNGVTVTLTVSRSTDGTTITIHHTATLADGTSTYDPTATVSNVGATDDVWFQLADEASHQVISNVLFTNAAGTKTNYSGVLNHTAQYASGKNTAGNSTDAEQQYYNYDKSGSSYSGGWAYADFNFTVPTDMTVSSANLTWSALNCSNGGARDNTIYALNAGTTFDYTYYGNYQSSRSAAITTVTWPRYTSTTDPQTATTDVTAAITALAASQSYAIFQWTNNTGGAYLYGMASALRPVLEVVSTNEVKAAYTINYVNGENTVKTVTGTEVVGQTVTADRKITGTDEVTYLADDATLPSMTIADGENVLNVNVHKQKTATLTVTTTVGTDEPTVATTNLIEADDLSCNWSYKFPLYTKNAAGVYYKTDATTFGEAGTFADGDVIEKTVTYATEASDVYYFAEGESSTAVTGTNYAYSNGQEGYVAAQNARGRGLTVGTLAAGNYQLVVMATGANKRAVVLRSGTADPFATTDAITSTGLKTIDFTLAAETSNIFVNGANSGTAKTNQSENFDYVLIQKVHSYSVTANRTTIISGTAGAGTVKYWSKYQKIGDKWYSVPSTSMTVSANDADNVIELEATETDVVYFTECENMNKSRSDAFAATLTGAAYSNGISPRHLKSSYWYGEAVSTEAGTYTLSMPCKNNNSSATTIAIYYRDSEGNLTETGKTFECAATTSATITVNDVQIPANCSLVLYNTNTYNSNVYIDYVTLAPYAAPTTVNVTTIGNGWASFTNNTGKNVKLQEVEEGTAPIAYVCTSVDNETAMFKEVTVVPTGVGVFVKGDAKTTYTFEATEDEASEITVNYIYPCVDDVTLDGTEGAYALATIGDACGLYKVDVANTVIPKGKAYILATSNAKALAFGFVGGATAINAVDANVNANNTMADGKFVKNGRIVIVKNGKQYNAAGAQVK